MHTVYAARQAIFNTKQNVVAYELFFRDGPENFFPNIDAHEATSKLIARTFLNEGLKPMTSNKQALINFSEKSLLLGLPYLLNPSEIVIEILETVSPSDEVYAACLAFYKAGYKMALDDFVYKPEWNRFISLVKLIKFDIRETPLSSIEVIVRKLKDKKILLAEKVETKEEFIQAKSMGFSFFQGFFFAKPEMQKKRDSESNEHILFLLQRESLRKIINNDKIASLFEQDANITYKLLRFINSGTFKLLKPITSIKQALIYLGDTQVRRIVSLITTSVLANNKPAELTKMCIIRARFCEAMMERVHPTYMESAFLTGMFSLLDAILDKPIKEIIEELPLSDDIVECLTEIGCHSPIAIALRIVNHLEKGEWHLTDIEAKKLKLNYKIASNCYREAVIWSDFQEL